MNKKIVFEKIVDFLKKVGAKKIAIFGSFSRDEAGPQSDIDILIEFSNRITLLDYARIERELSEELGLRVHLLTEKSISPLFIDDIKKEMVILYQ